MALIVKVTYAHGLPGGKAVLLCDGDGNAFPTQIEATVTNGINTYPTITVELAIDGENVRFE